MSRLIPANVVRFRNPNSVFDGISILENMTLSGPADQARRSLVFMLQSTFLSDPDTPEAVLFSSRDIQSGIHDLEDCLTANRDKFMLATLQQLLVPPARVVN